MSINHKFLKRLQESVDRHLNTLSLLKDIPVLSSHADLPSGSLDELALAGAGICCTVMAPVPKKVAVTPHGISYEQIILPIQLSDNYYVQEQDEPIMNLAEGIAIQLHGHKPEVLGWQGWISLNENEPWTHINTPDDFGRYVLQLNFTVTGATVRSNTVTK